MKGLRFFGLLIALATFARAADTDPLMGSVVKSDKWKMDRKNNLEYFDGAVSFKNPNYAMRSEHAVYDHSAKTWNIYGSAYILRKFTDSSSVEIECEKGKYFEAAQTASLERGAKQIRMKYRSADPAADSRGSRAAASRRDSGPEGGPIKPGPQPAGGAKELRGYADKVKAENALGLMTFDGDFSLATENLYMLSQKGLYHDSEKSFLMYESTPIAVGMREGYNFAITAEKIKFFKDSRDIKFYNNVSGWVKDIPLEE
jgi:hypothetical protein